VSDNNDRSRLRQVADIAANDREIYFPRRKLLSGSKCGPCVDNLEPHRRIDRDQTTYIALDTSLLQEFFNQISSSATADVLPRIVGKMSAGNFRSDATRPSVDSATDNDTSRGDHSGSGHGTVCDDCAAGPYAACPVHTARAYNGACFHGAQGDEAAYQQ
jgi:hypothetical protein